MKYLFIYLSITLTSNLFSQTLSNIHTIQYQDYYKIKKDASTTVLWFDMHLDSILFDGKLFIHKSPTWEDESVFFIKLDSLNNIKKINEFYTKDTIKNANIRIFSDFIITKNGYSAVFDYGGRDLWLNDSLIFLDSVLKIYYLSIANFSKSGEFISCWQYPMTRLLLDVKIQAHINGQIIVSGTTSWDTIQLGQFTLPCIACHVHDNDVFIAILDSSGNVLNAKRFGSDITDYCRAVATTDNGDIYLTGSYSGRPFEADSFSLNNQGFTDLTSDAFILKMNKNLEVQWLNRAWGNGTESGRDLALDQSGNLYWSVEYFSDTVRYADVSATGINANAFVAKLNPDGEVLWLQNLTADEVISLRDIDADAAGNLWATVNFGYQLAFAGQTATTAGGWDNITMQLDRDDGHLLQHYHITGPEQQSMYQVQALPDNGLLLVGAFSSDTLSFLNVNLPNTAQGSSFLDFYATLQLPTVGTQEPMSKQYTPLLLWPNPLGMQSTLSIQLPSGGGTTTSEVSTYNFMGQLAGRFPVNPATRQAVIPAGYFEPGVYTVTYGRLSGILVVIN